MLRYSDQNVYIGFADMMYVVHYDGLSVNDEAPLDRRFEFVLVVGRPSRSRQSRSAEASDVYKGPVYTLPAPANARNWRLDFTQGVGGNSNGIRVMEWTLIGARSDGYLSGGTPPADSEYSPSTLAGAAFDDDITTGWDGCCGGYPNQEL